MDIDLPGLPLTIDPSTAASELWRRTHPTWPSFVVPSGHVHDAGCPSGCGMLDFATFSLQFGSVQIEEGDTAVLFDVRYKHVAIVPLPVGERPTYVLHDGRVFAYYAHTTVVGTRDTTHPYREVTDLYVAPVVVDAGGDR